MVTQSLARPRSLRSRGIVAATAAALLLSSVASTIGAEPAAAPGIRGDVFRPVALAPASALTRSGSVPQPINRLLAEAMDDVSVAPAAAMVATRAESRPLTSGTNRYLGRNHVWIPWLGIDRDTILFACSRSSDPANYIYRWGCAGRNNVYLLGHAFSVFRALHDAYTNGRLARGLPVYWADAAGHVTIYR